MIDFTAAVIIAAVMFAAVALFLDALRHAIAVRLDFIHTDRRLRKHEAELVSLVKAHNSAVSVTERTAIVSRIVTVKAYHTQALNKLCIADAAQAEARMLSAVKAVL